ncbi:GNAT family N-acetyltransferase [Actinomadura sp. NPDC048955]|uniref:GNAT family N-acetyltransferase n=1 Tax=Actinomadura sp. NPDC048955 TaxID=3158228 RepID=UPI0033D79CBE
MIEVRRGDELGEDHRRRITAVLVHGFAQDFAFFSSDPRKLTNAFEHMVLLNRFYVALLDGEPAAVASVTAGAQECFAPRWSEIRRHLGAVHGTISHLVLRSQFLGAADETRAGLAEIGFVTTEPGSQGRGVATALMRHILALPDYDEFVLRDIKDTNAPALGLYAKLGFTEYRRRPVRFARRAGFTDYVSMRLAQTG